MRFFRSTWLTKILIFLWLVLLNASSFAFVEQQRDTKDQSIIHSPYSLAELTVSFQKNQTKYGYDATQVSEITILTEIITEDDISGASVYPISTNLLTNPSRAPPHLIAIL
jgi:hypothetical protein